jgi:hypothetical protein
MERQGFVLSVVRRWWMKESPLLEGGALWVFRVALALALTLAGEVK